jgi:hypothetical protein
MNRCPIIKVSGIIAKFPIDRIGSMVSMGMTREARRVYFVSHKTIGEVRSRIWIIGYFSLA